MRMREVSLGESSTKMTATAPETSDAEDTCRRARFDLTDAQWTALLPVGRNSGRPPMRSKRTLIEADSGAGAGGRAIAGRPERHGSWQSVY